MTWTIVAAIGSFALGYLTCSIFYFTRSSQTSLVILRMAQIIYLTILMRCIEDWYFSHTTKLDALRKNGVSYRDEAYIKIKKEHDESIAAFKDKSIKFLIESHPGLFKEAIDFNDWRGAMRFLEKHKGVAIFFNKGINQ